jgi:hypothetical protein
MDPVSFMCDASRCPVRIGAETVFKDEEHVTASFSRSVAAHFEPFLAQLVANAP